MTDSTVERVASLLKDALLSEAGKVSDGPAPVAQADKRVELMRDLLDSDEDPGASVASWIKRAFHV